MNRIGFMSEEKQSTERPIVSNIEVLPSKPRRSVVQVQFPGNGKALAYYNDMFDLHVGDLVFVEGKMEGIRGRVVEINYNFKIKLSEYKRVIYLVDTDVHGEFYAAGSHMVTFDSSVLPVKKVRTWFMAPRKEEDEYVSGNDDSAFSLENIGDMKIDSQIAARGHEYYMENHVKYLSVDGTHGYAIVQGSEPYEVEFEFCNGMISNLTCSCFCSYNCKHEFAAMLQLRETLEMIERHYSEKHNGYFAAIPKETLFSVAIDGKETGRITL